MIGRTVGRYRILRELGRGGMGEVYVAEDTKLIRKVALKLLPPDVANSPARRKRFEREARSVAALSHPNILAIHDFGEDQGECFAVMELLEGDNLRTLLGKGPLSPGQAVDLAKQIAEGMAAAHEKGIVHRDLKPENLFVTAEGQVKILDFGLAKAETRNRKMEDGKTGSCLTQPGTVMGTPSYMSPEHLQGLLVDHRSDIFSFGAVVYEMLSGQRAFSGESEAEILSAILRDNPLEISKAKSGIPSALDPLVSRCLEKRPGDRFQSARDVVFALDAIADVTYEETTRAREQARLCAELPSFLQGQPPPTSSKREVFVARERELSWLEGTLEKALAGSGQIAFVIGDAGQGKTSLVGEFARRARAAHSDLIVATGTCDMYTGVGDPYLPFRGVLRMLTADVEHQWAAGAIDHEHAVRLWRALPRVLQALVEHGADLVETFVAGEPLENRARAACPGGARWLEALQQLVATKKTPGRDRSPDQTRIFEEYAAVLEAIAAEQPLLLILEDLHWSDVSSASLLFHLGRRISNSRILILGTYRQEDIARPERDDPAALDGVLKEFKRYLGDVWLNLNETGKAEGRAFVDALVDSEPNRLNADFRRALVESTEGNALFTVELLRDMRERGDLQRDEEGHWIQRPHLAWDKLPVRVESVIEKRIGRLSEALREVLKIASVEGEEFTAEVVARVMGIDSSELVRRLSSELDKQHRLVSAQGVRRLGDGRLSRYRFRHALFHRYVYLSMDEVERAYKHEAVGRELEACYGERAAEISVQLARHFQEAVVTDKAIDYLHKAGVTAVRLCANDEAIDHLRRGLALLETLPESPERHQQELEIQTTLGPALIASKGFASPDVEMTYARARSLCRAIGDPPRVFPVLRGLFGFYMIRHNLETARELADECLRLAKLQNDPALLMEAHLALGWWSGFRGEFVSARAHFEESLRLYDREQHRSLALVYGEDPRMFSLGLGGWCLWILGYPDQARIWADEAVRHAQEIGHPYSLAFAWFLSAGVWLCLREPEGGRERAESAIALSVKHGFSHWRAEASIMRGWAMVQQGQVQDGTEEIRTGLAAWRDTGAVVWPYHLLLLAWACGKAGRVKDGLSLLAEGEAKIDETGDRWWEAELYRIKGELLLQALSDRTPETQREAEACFRRSIECARYQSARSWELRAAMSLCRLLRDQDRAEQGRHALQEVYSCFSEGFDTPDLKEAKALLEELAYSSTSS